jgi:transcriptional regulator with XRE-family HTH domain
MDEQIVFRKQFGAGLTAWMRRRRVKQEGLAEVLGVTQQTISKWCAGDALPTVDKVPAIAAALRCEIADLCPPVGKVR